MAAISVCLTMGMQSGTISQAMDQELVIPGRLETISTNSLGKVFIDYAHTPDAYEKLFSTISRLCPKGTTIYFNVQAQFIRSGIEGHVQAVVQEIAT